MIPQGGGGRGRRAVLRRVEVMGRGGRRGDVGMGGEGAKGDGEEKARLGRRECGSGRGMVEVGSEG